MTESLCRVTETLCRPANRLVGLMGRLCRRASSTGVLTKQLVQSSKALVGLNELLVGLAQPLRENKEQTCRLAGRLCGPYETLCHESKLQ